VTPSTLEKSRSTSHYFSTSRPIVILSTEDSRFECIRNDNNECSVVPV
jgi:hypothetical protein